MSRSQLLLMLIACGACMATTFLPAAAASSRALLGDKPLVPGIFGDLNEFNINVNIAPDQLIVKFKIGCTSKDQRKVLKEVGAEIVKVLKPEDAESGELALATFAALSKYGNTGGVGKAAGRAALKEMADSIKANELVATAYPNWVINPPVAKETASPMNATAAAAAVEELAVAAGSVAAAALPSAGSHSPNDVLYLSGQQWNMEWNLHKTGLGGANAVEAWQSGCTSCDGVTIAVVDSGLQINHKDLAANIWTNPRELVIDKLDNDASGKADDKWGWDFVSNRRTVYSPSNFPLGTHVAGTIGAVGNNAIGVAGVCWSGVKMISAQIFSKDGSGMMSDLLEAMQYLRRLRDTGVNIVAISSTGIAEFPKVPTMDGTIKSVTRLLADASKDMLLVVPAGNTGGRIEEATTIPVPTGLKIDNMIVVGGLRRDGQPSSWSSYGAAVNIFAPSDKILSTTMGSKYDVLSGTAMAVPHVTGAAGLYAAAYNKKYGRWPTALDIKAAILATGKDNPALAGKCSSGKQLDIGALLASLERS